MLSYCPVIVTQHLPQAQQKTQHPLRPDLRILQQPQPGQCQCRSGVPCGAVNLAHSACADVQEPVTLSQAGGEQLELAMLSSLTGNSTFWQKAERAIQQLQLLNSDQVPRFACILQSSICVDNWLWTTASTCLH